MFEGFQVEEMNCQQVLPPLGVGVLEVLHPRRGVSYVNVKCYSVDPMRRKLFFLRSIAQFFIQTYMNCLVHSQVEQSG